MSDEEDRRRAYAELEKRGQRTPGKYFGPSTPSLPIKKTPKIKVIDMSKMKQLKLLNKGGETDPVKKSLAGIEKVVANVSKGKTGVKSLDRQKKKDAAMIKKLKRSAKVSTVRAKPITLDITPDSKSPFSIQKQTILMADGGEVVNMTKSKMINPKTGE